jgi:hypothetical protein
MPLLNAIRLTAQLEVIDPDGVELGSARPQQILLDILENQPHKTDQIQTVTNTVEQLDIIGDLTDAGFCHVQNLDDEEPVLVGVEDGSSNFIPMLRLRPGAAAVFELATNDIFVRKEDTSESSTARVRYFIMER